MVLVRTHNAELPATRNLTHHEEHEMRLSIKRAEQGLQSRSHFQDNRNRWQ
jgi:hypothetical protein